MSKFNFKTVILFFVLISTTLFSFRINDPFIQKIIDYFTEVQTDFPVEKVHLHLDSDTYTLGDDIWFSVYLTAGVGQVPSPLSKTLYVNLFDGEGNLVSEKIVLIENGFGHGDFKLPNFGSEGIYRIKAFTAWMENFGEEYFYHQEIQVFDGNNRSFFPKIIFENRSKESQDVKYTILLDALDGRGAPLKNATLGFKVIADSELLVNRDISLNSQGEASLSFTIPFKPYSNQRIELEYLENENYTVKKEFKIPYSIHHADIQFLPEGGNLLQGFKSNVAFKGVYPDGSPVNFKGKIVDLDEPIEFKPFFGGMGKFEITPDNQPKNVLITDEETGESFQIKLPQALEKGIVLKVLNNDNQSYITVYVEGNLGEEELTLVSHSKGWINFISNGTMPYNVWGVRIPKQNIQQGINHITILTQDGKPLAERLFFYWNNEEQYELSVKKKSDIKPRSEVILELEALLNQNPHEGRFSISVVDADQQSSPTNSTNTIFTNLLLTSDLKGTIYQPNYYLKDRNDTTLLALDLVMMTNGWRRFDWEDVFSNKFPEVNKLIEQGISISGEIKPLNNTRRGLKGGIASAMIGQGDSFIRMQFGEDGRFLFPNLVFFEDTPVTISGKDDRQLEFVEVIVHENKRFLDSIPKKVSDGNFIPNSLLETFAARQLMSRLQDDERLIDLQEFEVQAQTLYEENLDQRRIYGRGDVVIEPDKILGVQGAINIFEMIQGRVAGVQVVTTGLNATVTIRGPGSVTGGTEPLFLLDNTPVDMQTLMQVNPRDVKAIDIFKDPARAAIFGSQGANGAIAVYTRSGFEAPTGNSVGSLMSNIKGYATPREFYQPKYDKITPETATSDQRKTIYWNPNLELKAGLKSEIKFFNTDLARRHLLIIEGMDANGRLIRFEKIME
ncbi:TonB-dependent receptor [Mongoliitalea lutea]|uniref:TonB-dependent receptor n=1 Tax=Mongoliitalea lutea TaxID=849756 RepID=A0A8J3G551_9BACT|nr:TonB-dependent receptor plug domain-containing protein [Mongoliitalea lutea]GHB35567.1 TonB-dependent receptor [Mongoliitalea lutea]